jgi:hypothetical protein
MPGKSQSGGGRLRRRRPENHVYVDHRKAFPKLMEESENRCAYSLVHVDYLGEMTMEVDHYNPTFSKRRRNWHGNLVPATRECNGLKSNYWPTDEQLGSGLYIINPYEEHDYGKHMTLDPETGKLRGETRTGRFQIAKLNLNAPRLVGQRLLSLRIRAKGATGAAYSSLDDSGALFKALMLIFEETKTLGLIFPDIETEVVYD